MTGQFITCEAPMIVLQIYGLYTCLFIIIIIIIIIKITFVVNEMSLQYGCDDFFSVKNQFVSDQGQLCSGSDNI